MTTRQDSSSLNKDQSEAKKQILLKAIRLKPEMASAHANLGRLYAQQGEFKQAIECYQEAVNLEPEKLKFYWPLIELLQNQQEWHQLETVCRQGINYHPQVAQFHHLLGNSLLNTERWEEAVEAYQSAIALNGKSAVIHKELGIALENQQQFTEAIASYRQAITLNPKDLSVYERLLNRVQKSAFTIVSKNYISLARVLAESFLKFHPDAVFFLVLVDRIDGYFNPEQENFEVIQLEEIPLPNRTSFPYWYTILELNTAVKPFAFEYIFNKYESIQHLLYIDPDIQVFSELEKIWQELKYNSVVLTPHMRKPFNDDLHPTELNILQSGSYNLGFIGLTRSKQSLQLLRWWQERLYLDCVVDIPRGLFTDQKWIDLVPSYFSETAIIREPSYNVAYWNIHEREIEKNAEGEYVIEGDVLRFFHFSGYSPKRRNQLSKHQNRHNIRHLPIIKELCDQYGDRLLKHGYMEASQWPYAFGIFGNNIKIAGCIIWVVRECVEKNISFPDLNQYPEDFCQFLFTPNPYFTGFEVPPIYVAIFTKRPDVKNAFPNASYNPCDEGFLSWLTGNGKKELDLEYLVDNYIDYVKKENPIRKILNIYEKRLDLQSAFPLFWRTLKQRHRFQKWLTNSGIKEHNLSAQEIDLFYNSYCFHKVLLFYYQRPDLQKAFCRLHEPSVLDDFTDWLIQNIRTLPNISYENVIWFNFISKKESELTLKINVIYNNYLRSICGDFSLFSIDSRSKFLNIDDQSILSDLCLLSVDETMYPLHDHIKLVFKENQINQNSLLNSKEEAKIENNIENILESLTFYSDISQQIQQAIISYQSDLKEIIHSSLDQDKEKIDDLVISLAGNMSAITGMGQSARSMVKTVESANLQYKCFDIPNTFIEENGIEDFDDPWLMGWYYPKADLTISVINADSFSFFQKVIPSSYWTAKKNIGYWIWETDKLPLQWESSAIAFDEIWTASQYSASAISKTINKPVRVIPHIIDFEKIDHILSNAPEQKVLRRKFGLPEDGFLFGFFFDPKSYMERKNPAAVIQSFRTAFLGQDNAYLILKVNGSFSSYEYDFLKSSVTDSRIIFLEESLYYDDVIKLMNCLDCYVSLHRGEGFGLTLAEAMAVGKPTIATAYSGNMEFMNSDNSLLVDYQLIKTERPYGPYPKGTVWADPNVEQASKLMLELYNNHDLYETISAQARRSIQEQLAPEKVSLILKDYLKDLLF
ncbi:glycosyl transferase group 1 [Halothece sp. PCC 7418]|uniref:tetratricopeptide repeat-containing glycosyltransferase family protein n=1 Tax=Halothece sp. (strain PCC 7418) TaxID=65093 RepID=UPI0002A07DBB|nr:glycosyltransferase [Halothece sp. PCC 7418]AFZ43435.1 glycosyl transferase group 1 [Halothece sp. PCC 7418]